MNFGNVTTGWMECKPMGCYYRLEQGTLMAAPMLLDGTMEQYEGEHCEVEFDAFEGAELAALITIGRMLEGQPMEGEAGDTLPMACPKCFVRWPDKCQC